jgi:hypothetical protein
MGTPKSFSASLDRRRTTMSVCPPAAHPTIIVSGRLGKVSLLSTNPAGHTPKPIVSTHRQTLKTFPDFFMPLYLLFLFLIFFS